MMKNKHTIVLGTQFGDEGKGKLADLLAKDHSHVVRFHGGSNAGHTIIINGVKTVLHLIPSGILSGTPCFIGNGVAFNPEEFEKEINLLKSMNIDTSLVKVSENAHVVMPYHIELDKQREATFKLGTTQRGIGPCYEDKAARRGIQVKDLFNNASIYNKIFYSLKESNHTNVDDSILMYQASALAQEYTEKYNWLKDHIVPANYLQNQENILFEGAQSSLLDLDHGSYPYVTSSNCVSNYAGVGSGVSLLNKPVEVLGVFKAYMTKVGEGPFPTSIEQTDPALATSIREKGKEYGATTGRPRQIGWLDLDSLKEVIKLNGITSLALMKSDVFCGQDFIKVKMDNQLVKFFGWGDLSSRTFTDFIKMIEEFTSIPIKIISTGPGREETIVL